MSIKSEIAALKAAAQSHDHADDTVIASWPDFTKKLIADGQPETAAKLIAGARRRGELVTAPAELEPAIRRHLAAAA